jgi:heptosyltransferase I
MTAQVVSLRPHARMLIVRMGALGDIIHALPVLAALRANRPDVSVDWLVDARYAQVLAMVDGVRTRVVVRAREPAVAAEEVRFAGAQGMVAAVHHLRAQAYDAAVDLQGLLKSAAFARGSGARRVIGFNAAQLRERTARWFYSDVAPVSPLPHVIEKNLSTLAVFGLPAAGWQFGWRPVASAVPALVRQETRVREAQGVALLNPGAAWPNKRWPPGHFGALAARLGDRLNLASVIVWGPGERELADEVVSHAAGHAVLAPPSALHDVLALAREARLVVSGDTGPLHLAASVRAPVVALFGPTLPDRNGPGTPEGECVSRATACACLYKRRCHRGTACIDGISVEDVYAACVRRIGAGAAA